MANLYGQCQGCGRADGVLMNSMYVCPRCAGIEAIFEASHNHLSDLLTAAFNAWLDLWETNPIFLDDRASLISSVTETEHIVLHILSERRKPRKVRR